MSKIISSPATCRVAWGSTHLQTFSSHRRRHSPISPISSMSAAAVSIVWFRGDGDLRLTDNEPLHQAIASSGSTHLIPFFCLDDEILRPHQSSLLGLPATGPHRLAALLHAVRSLRTSLRELGSDLICCRGSTAAQLETLTAALAEREIDHRVTLHFYPSLDLPHVGIENAVQHAIQSTELQYSIAPPCSIGNTFLYHPADIVSNGLLLASVDASPSTSPPVLHINADFSRIFNFMDSNGGGGGGGAAPMTMTQFRATVQHSTPVRAPLPPLTTLPPLPSVIVSGGLPHLDLGMNPLDDGGDDDGCGGGEWSRELYAAAGAGEALLKLQEIVGRSAINQPSFQTVIPLTDQRQRCGGESKEIKESSMNAPHCLHSAVQKPPISETEVKDRLQILFAPKTNGDKDSMSNTNAAASPPLMLDYRESRMTAGNSLKTSAMLSTALSLGTISPRTLYWEIVKATLEEEQQKAEQVENTTASLSSPSSSSSTLWRWEEPTKESSGHRWLLMHLGIRDYFQFYALKERKSLLLKEDENWLTAESTLSSSWCRGQTGFPYVDACMRELAATGWLSNRGRQNSASFLSKALGVDWRCGVELFQALLIDHDPKLNLGNWAYVSGVAGSDPRDRSFKTVTQGEKYDPEGSYIAAWVPEVAALPAPLRHRPWDVESGSEKDLLLSDSYPDPVIDPTSQIGKGPRRT